MGRVVKGAQIRQERYALSVPEIAPPQPDPVDAYPGVDEYGYGVDPGSGNLDPSIVHASSLPAAPAVDVEHVRAEAKAIVDEAAIDADALLVDAHARARATLEDAGIRAATILEDARRAGHEAGFATGRDEADREMNDMLVTMRGLLEMARVERHKIIESAEPELVRLALGIAERVLHQQVALDRGVVVEMARGAIARLIERDTVTIRVNPADLERMRDHREELVAMADIRNLRVVEDLRVDRGGVIVETEAGTIDARIGTQLDEVRKVLHIEDDIIIEAAPEETGVAAPEFSRAS